MKLAITALALSLGLASCDRIQQEIIEEVLQETAEEPSLCRPAGLAPSTLEISGRKFEDPLIAAGVEANDFGRMEIKLKMTTKQSKWFTQFTKDNIGEIAEIVVDGDVLASPKIMEPVYGSEIRISGNFTMTEADAMARKLAPPCN